MLYAPEDLYKAETSYAPDGGYDYTLGLLRAMRAAQEKNLPNIPCKMAAWIVAPVLASFAAFMAEQGGSALMLGVMREGQMLCSLMQRLFNLDAKEIWLNRSLSMLAAFGCGDDEALVNWLVRTRNKPIAFAEAVRKLTGETIKDKRTTGLALAYAFLQEAEYKKLLAKARQCASDLADRMVKYVKQVAAGHYAINLMDFACAGNIQRSLETVLKARDIPLTVTGLNFSMTAGSSWARQKGCVMKGFLAQAGQPAGFAQAYAASPEVMEVFAASPFGSLTDYSESGDPVYGESFLSHDQKTLVLAMRKHILIAASQYHNEFKGRITADIARCLWGRLLIKPMPQELAAFKSWPLDAGLDGSAQRKLVTKDGWTKR